MTHLTPTLPDPPDWPTITDQVTCPLCTYDLRGLVDPRCPECGYAFTWPSLFESRRATHPYLFEHHPKRNLRSFLRTTFAGLNPWRFWTALSPAHAIHPRRLVLYWFLSLLPTLLAAAVVSTPYVVNRVSQWQAWRTRILASYTANPNMIPLGMTPQSAADLYVPPLHSPRAWFHIVQQADENLLPVLCLAAAWPWLTFLTLQVFRQSMRQARVRPAHILRCVIYSADAANLVPTTLILLALLTFFVTAIGAPNFLSVMPRGPLTYFPVVILAATALATVRLTLAYHHYLCFRHPLLTILASQVVVALIAYNVYLPWVIW